MKKWFLSLLITLALTPGSYGQTSGLYYLDEYYSDDPFDELTYFSAGLNTLTNNVYLGRKDSARLPYINPYIGYNLHNGMYGKATVSYAPTRINGHFDLLTVELGYDRTFGHNVLAGIYAEKYFYYSNSPSIRYAIKEGGGIYCLYKNDLIEPQFNFNLNHSTVMDFVIGAAFDHNFRLADNTFNIIPTIAINAGSQNYYNEYFTNRALKKDNIVITNQVVENAGSIKALDIEFSVKTTYRTKGWFFTFKPTYAIPLGAGKVILPGKTVTQKLTGTTFLELDICYRHERK